MQTPAINKQEPRIDNQKNDPMPTHIYQQKNHPKYTSSLQPRASSFISSTPQSQTTNTQVYRQLTTN